MIKFEESHGTFDEEWKKKPPTMANNGITKFEKSCGTFRIGGGKKSLPSMTLG